MSFRKQQTGVTLIEAVLVLVIASALIVLGIRQYQRYSRDNEVRQVISQVDQLFQGLAQYYQANCRANLSGSVVTLSIKTGANSLVNSGYVPNWRPIANKLVDTTFGENGFAVQLNGQQNSSRTPDAKFKNWVCTNPAYPPSTCTTVSISFSSSVGTVFVWQSHIAMKLAAGLDSAVYKGRLGASCTSSDPAAPCSSSSTGQYLIWESLPSSASRSTYSVLTSSMARLKSFTNLYYTDDMYGASNPSWGNNKTNTSLGGGNNYLCGN